MYLFIIYLCGFNLTNNLFLFSLFFGKDFRFSGRLRCPKNVFPLLQN